MYRDEISRRDLHFKLEHNKVIGTEGGSEGGYEIKRSEIVVVPETTATPQDAGDWGPAATLPDFNTNLIEGHTYKVTFNGEEYILTAEYNDEIGLTYLGELYPVSGQEHPVYDTYPFFVVLGSLYAPETTPQTITVIEEVTEVITTEEFKDAVADTTGYSLQKSLELILEESVTTSLDEGFVIGEFSQSIPLVAGDEYKVTFDGVEYTCYAYDADPVVILGAPYLDSGSSWDVYPFSMDFEYLYTENEGTYQVKIEHVVLEPKTTKSFSDLIKSSISGAFCPPYSFQRVNNVAYAYYKEKPVQGNIYILPYYNSVDGGTTMFQIYMTSLEESSDTFVGDCSILGSPLLIDTGGTCKVLSFGGVVNPSGISSGINLEYDTNSNAYVISYHPGGIG